MTSDGLAKTDPLTCPHRHETDLSGHWLCTLKGGEVWVMCAASHFGQPPTCVYEWSRNGTNNDSREVRLEND